MVTIQKIQERRINKRPQIVTYDWLEDSIDAKRPIRGTDKYDPGQPRDIDGMVAAWKESKFSVRTNADGTAKTFRKKTREENGQDDSLGGISNTNIAKMRETKAGEEVVAVTKAINSFEASLGQKNQAIVGNKTLASSHTKQSSSAQATSQPKKEPVIIVAYKDEIDRFPYDIELPAVRPHPNVDKYVLQVIMTTNRVPNQFRFRASYYDKKGKETPNTRGPWVCSAKEALDEFTKCFHKKTGYAWEKRLLKTGKKGGNGGKWYYEVPARGEPRGAVPPEYTPGHPKCVGLLSMLPNATRRPLGLLNTACTIEKRAASDPPRKTYKKGSFALHKPQKRKLEDCPSAERRVKVQKIT